MRLSQKLAVVFAALTITFPGASLPAHALVSVGVSTSCGYGQTCVGYFQGPIDGGGVASCTAATPYKVVYTEVLCYVVGNNGDVHWTINVDTSGQASTLHWVFFPGELSSSTYQLCVGAGYSDGTFPPHEAINGTFICMTTV